MKKKMKKQMRRQAQRISLEGVTVNGIPLQSFLNDAPIIDEERREIEEVKKEKVFTYKRPVIRSKPQTEKNGKVKRLMTSELNRQNYGSYMAKFKEINDLRSATVAALLCSGKRMTCEELSKEVYYQWRKIEPNLLQSAINTNAVRTYLGQLKRSDLSEFLFVSRKKAGVPTNYGMTEVGYNLVLSEALSLSKLKTKWNVGTPEVKKDPEVIAKDLPKEAKQESILEIETPKIDEVIPKSNFPNIKISISGVKIYFTPETKNNKKPLSILSPAEVSDLLTEIEDGMIGKLDWANSFGLDENIKRLIHFVRNSGYI